MPFKFGSGEVGGINMERFTEYHCGVAVIKDKEKLPEALRKLASYEDAEELSEEFNKLTEDFAAYVCDEICPHPYVLGEEDLSKECEKCKLETYINTITSKYLEIDRFVGSELEKKMIENRRLQRKLQKVQHEQQTGNLSKL